MGKRGCSLSVVMVVSVLLALAHGPVLAQEEDGRREVVSNLGGDPEAYDDRPSAVEEEYGGPGFWDDTDSLDAYVPSSGSRHGVSSSYGPYWERRRILDNIERHPKRELVILYWRRWAAVNALQAEVRNHSRPRDGFWMGTNPGSWHHVDINVRPRKAVIRLNGIPVGRAGHYYRGFWTRDYLQLRPGDHVLEIRRPGYRTLRKWIRVQAGPGKNYIKMRLQRGEGIDPRSDAENADLFLVESSEGS